MKKAFKKALAILLATLMLMGVGAVASVAAFPEGFDKDEAIELALDASLQVSGDTWFRFTPARTGGYLFIAEESQRLIASLYNEKGELIGRKTPKSYLQERIYCKLTAGENYYLLTRYSFDYTVSVSACDGVLTAPANQVTVNLNENVYYTDLLAGTTWEFQDLTISYSKYMYGVAADGVQTGFYAKKPGTTTIEVTAPDGEKITIVVTAKATGQEWFKYYLLFGWFQALDEFGQAGLFFLLLSLPFLPLIIPLIILNYPIFWLRDLFSR